MGHPKFKGFAQIQYICCAKCLSDLSATRYDKMLRSNSLFSRESSKVSSTLPLLSAKRCSSKSFLAGSPLDAWDPLATSKGA